MNFFKNLWKYRELLYYMTWREYKVRYKHTLVGAAWVILQPFLEMVVFTIIFGYFAQISSEGIPYPIFVYTGIIAWNYFANVVSNSTASIIGNAALVTKIYCPKEIFPVSKSLSQLVDFGFSLIVLFGLMIYYKFSPGWGFLLLPLLLIVLFLISTGFGLLFAGINAVYRDIGFIMPYLLRLAMFVTPVIYPTSLIKGKWKVLLYLNPTTGLIESFRAALLGTHPFPILGLVSSCFGTIAILSIGIFTIRKLERIFVDLL